MVALSEKERAYASVRHEFDRIAELVRAHATAPDSETQRAIEESIRADAPQIAVRSNWHRPGDREMVSEYRILLSAGSPSVQIIGDIEDGTAYTARLGYQDWFTRWEEVELSEAEEALLLSYVHFFNFSL